MKNLQLYPRLFAFIALGFVIATIVGTVSHEMGHIAIAKSLGYRTILYYDSMDYNMGDKMDALGTYYDKHHDKIIARGNSPEKKFFNEKFAQLNTDGNLVTWGGPLQTMITGTIGLAALWFRRKKIAAVGMKAADWLSVILAFFWSRQLCNFLMGCLHFIKRHRWGDHDDESRLSLYMRLPVVTVGAVTGIIATAILSYVVFYIVPKQQRLTFIVAGAAGSILGWVVWMEWIGPVVLP
ncbi:hypothetical protein ACLI1A_09840 [Flavobacterium sp. RHBU_3]|uniref:hypothetical protein n=1 Tax=Flavobacterium sp. RHBU_3 TaxID=3391184 RepID=UPI0039848C18